MDRRSLFFVKTLTLLFMIVTLLTACCCDDDETSTPKSGVSVQTGHFVDSPVQGLSYETESQKGVTDVNGSFFFMEGETITFSISPTEEQYQGEKVVLGQSVPAKSQMSPVDLVPSASAQKDPIKNRAVTNISRLLQSLDQDGNTENGIFLSDTIRNEIAGRPIFFDISTTDFSTDTEITALMDRLNTMDPSPFSDLGERQLVTSTHAQMHLRESIYGEIDQILITPDEQYASQTTPEVPIGLNIGFVAYAHYKDEDKAPRNITEIVTWASSDSFISDSTNNTDNNGYVIFDAKNPGTTQINAILDGDIGRLNLHITPPALQRIDISPNFYELAKGEVLQFKAVGSFSNDYTENITDKVVWESANTSFAFFSHKLNEKGRIEAVLPGTTKISAAFDGISGFADLSVVDATIEHIELSPVNKTLAKGQSIQIVARGRFSDGDLKDITNQVDWVTSNILVASISVNGVVKAEHVGKTRIKATFKTNQKITGSTEITVEPPVAVSIEILSHSDNVAKGDTLQLTAIATYSDDQQLNVTQKVRWQTSNTSLAMIDSKGLINASHLQTYNYPIDLEVNAILDNVTGSKVLTVDEAAPKTVSIHPPYVELAQGVPQRFTALLHYTDGTVIDVIPDESPDTWWSHDTALNIKFNYEYETMSYSVTTENAESGEETDVRVTIKKGPYTGDVFIAPIVIKPAVLRKIQISVDKSFGDCGVYPNFASTPEAYTFPQGMTPQLYARGINSKKEAILLTTELGWSSNNTEVVSVNNENFKGLLDTNQSYTGSAIIRVVHSQMETLVRVPELHINIIEPVLTEIKIYPEDITLPKNEEQIFTGIGIYTDKHQEFITAQLKWESSDTTKAKFTTDSRTGVLMGDDEGNITITVSGKTKTLDGKASTIDITQTTSVEVLDKKPISLSILPEMINLPLGRTQQYTATLKYADDTFEDVTAKVSWSSSVTETATIVHVNNKVFAVSKAQNLTPTVITAHLYGLTDITHLTVTEHVLDKIEITDEADEDKAINSLNMQHGDIVYLRALGTFSDYTLKGNKIEDITTESNWVSEDNDIAKIVPKVDSHIYGVRGMKVGSTFVSASHSGITRTIRVTVTKDNIDRLVVIPSDTFVKVNNIKQFQAIGVWEETDGVPYTQVVTDLVNWTATNGSVDAHGAITPTVTTKNTPITVTATYLQVSDKASLSVYESDLLAVDIIAPATSLAKGRTMQLTSTMKFAGISSWINNPVIRWESSSDLIEISDTGQITAVTDKDEIGDVTIKAFAHNIFGEITITILERALDFITIYPESESLTLNEEDVNFTAFGNYSDGTIKDVTTLEATKWISSDPQVATLYEKSKGRIKASSVGKSMISVSYQNITETRNLSVVKPGLDRIEIEPSSPKVPVGYSLQLSATGFWNDGYTQVLTAQSKWSLTDSTVATITDEGMFEAHKICNVTVIAQYIDIISNVSGQAKVTVPTIQTGVFRDNFVQGLDYETLTQKGITNNKGEFKYLDGETVTFSIGNIVLGTARAKAEMTPIDLVDEKDVDFNHPKVIAICRLLQSIDSNGYLDDGIEILPSVASIISDHSIDFNNINQFESDMDTILFNIRDQFTANKDRDVISIDDARDHFRQTVYGSLVRIIVSADSLSVHIGRESVFSATAEFSTGKSLTVTSDVKWSASNEDLVEIDQNGIVKPKSSMGTVDIIATYEGITGRETLTIEDAEPDNIVIQQIPTSNEGQSIPLGDSVQLTATVFYSDGLPRPEAPHSFTWSSDSPFVTVKDGMVTVANHIENYTDLTPIVTARLAGMNNSVMGIMSISIGPKILKSLRLSPEINEIPNGKERSFQVIGVYSNTDEIVISEPIFSLDTLTVRTDDEKIHYLKALINSENISYTASMTISCDGLSESQNFEVVITKAVPDHISIEPSELVLLPLGESFQLTPIVIYTDGFPHPEETHAFDWDIEDQTVATITQDGEVIAHDYTQTNVKVVIKDQDNIQGITTIKVTKEILKDIKISPQDISIPNGTKIPVSVIGIYSNKDERPLSNVRIVPESQGITSSVYDKDEGIYYIGALIEKDAIPYDTTLAINCNCNEGLEKQFPVRITQAIPERLVVFPPTLHIPLGVSKMLTATVYYTDDTEHTKNISWRSENKNLATVDANSGQVTAMNNPDIRIVKIFADYTDLGETVSNYATINLDDAIVTSIQAMPESITIANGEFVPLYAIGNLSSGYTSVLNSNDISWESSHPAETTETSGGVTIDVSTYPTLVTLTLTMPGTNFSDKSYITVLEPQLELLFLSSSSEKINLGEKLTFTAYGMFSDGTGPIDLSDSVIWHSSNDLIAKFENSTNTIASSLTGTVVITATSDDGSVSGSTELRVGPAILTKIEIGLIDSIAKSVPKGLTLQFFVNATYSDKTQKKDIRDNSVHWESSSDNLLSFSSTTPGLATASKQSIGKVIVTASIEKVDATYEIEITDASLLSISVSPDESALPVGIIQKFVARGLFSDFTNPIITNSVTWSSSDPTVASIDSATGKATAISAGGLTKMTTISASMNNITGTAKLIVNKAQLIGISIHSKNDPITNATIPKGSKIQFSATGMFTDNNARELNDQDDLTWSSSDPTIVAINQVTGEATAITLSIAPVSIIAKCYDQSKTFFINVSGAELKSITITPNNSRIHEGESLQYNAMGEYTDGSKQDITAFATWASGEVGIARMDPNANGKVIAESQSVAPVIITAYLDQKQKTTILYVDEAILESIVIMPIEPTIWLDPPQVSEGFTLTFKATGIKTDNSLIQNLSVDWSVSDDTIGQFMNPSVPVITGIQVGQVDVIAEKTNAESVLITRSFQIEVVPHELKSLVITASADLFGFSPTAPSVPIGYTKLTFQAMGIYSDQLEIDRTSNVNWDVVVAEPDIFDIEDSGLVTVSESLTISTATEYTIIASEGGIEARIPLILTP